MKTIKRIILFVFLGIVSGLLILIGTFFNYGLNRLFKPPKWLFALNYLLGLLPLVSFIIVHKLKKHRKLTISGCCIGILITFFVILILNSVIGFGYSAKPETNVADYKDALERLGYPKREWLSHFPPNIPTNAENANFYWSKGFLQASMFIQLRLTLPKSEIESILKKSQARKVKFPNDRKVFQQDKLPFMPLGAGESEILVEWPEDFEIIVFQYGKPGYYKEEGYGTQEYWDKTYNYGIAVSKQRNEVIYWSEAYPH